VGASVTAAPARRAETAERPCDRRQTKAGSGKICDEAAAVYVSVMQYLWTFNLQKYADYT
jgi:hypothetical protein